LSVAATRRTVAAASRRTARTLLFASALSASTLLASAPLDPDTTARLLAGMQTGVPPHVNVSESVLREYAQAASAHWAQYERRIGKPMQKWARSELAPATGQVVFYPFSGPDFATVERMYPDASRYVLVALQRAGMPPALHKADASELGAFLARFGEAWKQFAQIGFFRTVDLDEEAKKPGLQAGTIGPLLAFAARAGYRVVALEPVQLDASGSDLEPHPGSRSDPATWSSVRIRLAKGTRNVQLDYVRMNLADSTFRSRPHLQAWIEGMAHHRTLLKGASHLLQTPRFSILRDALLAHAPSIVQDETGIEYSALRERFEVKLYGRFTKPHALFKKDAQRALAEAYQNQPDVKPLTFRVSYQRQPEANLQVAVKR